VRLLRSRKWRAAILTWAAMLLIGGAIGYQYRSEIEAYFDWHYKLYQIGRQEDGVRRDLARGTFRKGTPVDELFAMYTPEELYRNERLVIAHYRHGFGPKGIRQTTVAAKDGRLVSALYREGVETFVFFESISQAEWRQLYVDPITREFPVYRLAVQALAGPATFGFKHEHQAEFAVASANKR
jgi:hypothetical protein